MAAMDAQRMLRRSISSTSANWCSCEQIEHSPYLEAFRAKGRLDTLLASVPVRVALDPRAPLWGAAHLAALMPAS